MCSWLLVVVGVVAGCGLGLGRLAWPMKQLGAAGLFSLPLCFESLCAIFSCSHSAKIDVDGVGTNDAQTRDSRNDGGCRQTG